MNRKPLLQVENLTVSFPARDSRARMKAVNGVSFEIYEGETLGLVGESGCGKTTLGRAVSLLQRADSGRIHFNGRDLLQTGRSELRKVRRQIQMIFQSPFSSLDPRMSVLDTLSEALIYCRGIPAKRCISESAELMRQVGLDPSVIRKFPHEFSGGQRQRIAIARALAAGPSLVIADEPVSSLDVSVSAQILSLLRQLRAKMNLTMLFISHDLSIVKYMSHRTAVMFKGVIVETGATEDLFNNPSHPYTKMLLDAIPVPDPSRKILPGHSVPERLSPDISSGGCYFRHRCPISYERCACEMPALGPVGGNHYCACFRATSIELPA